MQGQIGMLLPGTKTNHFHDVVIDRNLVIRQTDPKLKFPGYIQGIDAFNVDWHNLTVSNNIVITSSCHGISYGSVHGALIINNTVLDDNSLVGTKDAQAGTSCAGSWIALGGSTHEGSPSNDIIVRNNIADTFEADNTSSNFVMDHNLCPLDRLGCVIVFQVDGKPRWNKTPGVYGDGGAVAGNIIDRSDPSALFVHFDPSHFAFDVRLKPGTRAYQGGNPDRAPAVNFEGAKRGSPPNIGAY